MVYCRCECAYLAVIIGIIAGVLLGVLYGLGIIATGIIFWAFLAIGLAGVFLAPLYAAYGALGGPEKCFCNHRRLLLVAAVGTIIAAVVGLIVAAVAPLTVNAIVLAITTFFATALLVSIICLARCLCR